MKGVTQAGRKNSSAPPTKRQRSPQGKTARMEFRLTAASKNVIERASSLSGLAPSDLAYEAARRVIDDHERFILQDADREVFFRALASPPAAPAALLRALRRHRAAAK